MLTWFLGTHRAGRQGKAQGRERNTPEPRQLWERRLFRGGPALPKLKATGTIRQSRPLRLFVLIKGRRVLVGFVLCPNCTGASEAGYFGALCILFPLLPVLLDIPERRS